MTKTVKQTKKETTTKVVKPTKVVAKPVKTIKPAEVAKDNTPKVVLASDHGGFELKEEFKKYFDHKKIPYKDLGCKDGVTSVSYATYGKKLGKHISENPNDIGIAICGTGLGISYAVNRFKGVRGARLTSIEDAKLAKMHNNANVLVFGGRQIEPAKAIHMYNTFMNTEFEGGRHIKRIAELDK